MLELRRQLHEMLGPRLRDLRLFGSKVRGDDRDESDIDVLVLVDGLDTDTSSAIIDLAQAVNPMLAPVVEEFEQYHAPISRATGFYKELRKESVQL